MYAYTGTIGLQAGEQVSDRTHSTSLSILNTQIRQDAEGRYCLNDCHKAAGSDPTKAPGQWLRNEQTQSLVAELTDVQISTSPVSAVKGGLNQGTYVAKELVYAYAMWISPAFHLSVIRAFDAMVSAPRQITFDPTRLIELGLMAFPNLSPIAQQTFIAKTSEIALGFPILPLPQVEEHYYSATEVGERLGVSSAMIGRIANRHNLKKPEYGIVVMDKSRHSVKQVEAFRYNAAGIEALRACLPQ